MTRKYIIIFALALVILGVLAGCRDGETVQPADALGVEMDMSIAPNPPQVGEATLVITLKEMDGTPIDNAEIVVRGDMNHAGMQPVLREVDTSREGDYQVPFAWTMGGDWFVVVKATLPDGRVVEKQFDYTVTGDDTMMDMATEES